MKTNGTFDMADFFSKAKQVRGTSSTPIDIEEVKPEPSKSKEMVYLGTTGIRIAPNGVMTKKEFLDKLEVDHDRYVDLKFSEKEVSVIKKRMNASSAGVSSAVPMICMGSSCPFANSCVYIELDKAPLGRECLIEAQLISYWVEQYMEEFDVQASRPSEVHLVSELAELNAYEMRITKYLADKNPTLLQDYETTNSMGDTITNKEVSKAFEVKERLKKNRMRILEALMATREKRAKIAVHLASQGGESTNKFADLAERMTQLKKDMETIKKAKLDGDISDADIIED